MKHISKTTHSKEWNNTMPIITSPFYGESLLGYLLRLAHINGFAPEFIIKLVCCRGQVSNISNIESRINIPLLSEISNISENQIRSMMIDTIRKKLYRYNNRHTKKYFDYGKIKICPICIQGWKMPMIFLFEGIDTCLMHGKKLISHCKCGKKINILNKNFPLSCSNRNCQRTYIDLVDDQERHTIDQQYKLQFLYNTYLLESIPLVSKEEKLVKGLKNRMMLIDSFKNKAIKSIYEIIPLKMNISPFPIFYHPRRESYMNFKSIVLGLYDLGLTPYEYMNLQTNYNEIVTCKNIRLGILSNKGVIEANTQLEFDRILKKYIDLAKVIKNSNRSKHYTFKNEFDSLLRENIIFGKIEVASRQLSTTYEFEIRFQSEVDKVPEYKLTISNMSEKL